MTSLPAAGDQLRLCVKLTPRAYAILSRHLLPVHPSCKTPAGLSANSTDHGQLAESVQF